MRSTQTSRTILITGASNGIGRSAALHLAGRGHRVLATGRNHAALEHLAAAAAGALEVLPLDVTDGASIERARTRVDELTASRGIDVLINNAGYGLAGPLEVLTDEDVRLQFETNVFGLLAVTRAFVPAMRRRGHGRVLNISSMAGRMRLPMFGAYHATKYAVGALSDALRLELAAFGVHVVLIEPGAVRTGFAQRTMDLLARYRTPDSPYAPVFARAERIQKQFDATAIEPERVVRVIERAIAARRPRARYATPWLTSMGITIFNALPTRWGDALLRRAVGLTPARLRLQAGTPLVSGSPEA